MQEVWRTNRTYVATEEHILEGCHFHCMHLHLKPYCSMPGRLIQGVKAAGVNNPVFLLDEVNLSL